MKAPVHCAGRYAKGLNDFDDGLPAQEDADLAYYQGRRDAAALAVERAIIKLELEREVVAICERRDAKIAALRAALDSDTDATSDFTRQVHRALDAPSPRPVHAGGGEP